MATSRDQSPRSEISAGVVSLLIGVVFTGIGWFEYRSGRALTERGVVTTATIASFEGRWNSRRHFGYSHWIQYDGNREYVSLPQRYEAGQNIRVVYDRAQPSTLRVLKAGEPSLQVDWFSSMIFAVVGTTLTLRGVFALLPVMKSAWAGYRGLLGRN